MHLNRAPNETGVVNEISVYPRAFADPTGDNYTQKKWLMHENALTFNINTSNVL